MDGPRNQFLTGTGFAQNQNIGIGSGDLFYLVENVLDGGTVADDALKIVNAIGKGEIIRPMQNGMLNPSLKK